MPIKKGTVFKSEYDNLDRLQKVIAETALNIVQLPTMYNNKKNESVFY